MEYQSQLLKYLTISAMDQLRNLAALALNERLSFRHTTSGTTG